MNYWMKFSLFYLAAGILILGLIYLQNKLSTSEAERDIQDILKGLDEGKKSFFEMFLEKALIPFIAITVILVGWPIVVAYKIKEVLFKKTNLPYEEEPEFSVKTTDLLEQFSKEEIEKIEKINDPLETVPDLPFGHLNSVWLEFLENYEQGDEIWTFSAKSKDWLKNEHLQNGYVIVREGVPGNFMITNIN